MPALQQFFRDERLRRGWSVREAAQRSQISASKAYAIENGDDNVEFETFENIASAFGLTPAELAVAIGKGADLIRQHSERNKKAAPARLVVSGRSRSLLFGCWLRFYRRSDCDTAPLA